MIIFKYLFKFISTSIFMIFTSDLSKLIILILILLTSSCYLNNSSISGSDVRDLTKEQNIILNNILQDKIPLGTNITGSGASDSLIPSYVDKNILDSFFVGEVTLDGSSYAAHDLLALGFQGGVTGNVSTVRPITSLLVKDDNLESEIFLESRRMAIGYFFVIDETIDLNKVSENNPLEITFLGKSLKITEIINDNSFKMIYGQKEKLIYNEYVDVYGKNIILKELSQNSVIIEVDGINQKINRYNNAIINGINIYVDDIFYLEPVEKSFVIIIIDAFVENINDGDYYKNKDDNCDNADSLDCWVWIVGQLKQIKNGDIDINSGTGPTLGLANGFQILNSNHNLIYLGKCINLPNNYTSICLDSLSVKSTDYMSYIVSKDEISLTQSNLNDLLNIPVISIKSKRNEGLTLKSNIFSRKAIDLSSSLETDEIYLYSNNSLGIVYVFYKDSDNLNKFAGQLEQSSIFGQVNYEKTRGKNIQLKLDFVDDSYNLTFDIIGDTESYTLQEGFDDITIKLRKTSSGFQGLGKSSGNPSKDDIVWGNTDNLIYLGDKEKSLRTAYGVIIDDPKGNLESDKFLIKVPADQVYANIILKSE